MSTELCCMLISIILHVGGRSVHHFVVTCPMARTHSFILMNLQFDIFPQANEVYCQVWLKCFSEELKSKCENSQTVR